MLCDIILNYNPSHGNCQKQNCIVLYKPLASEIWHVMSLASNLLRHNMSCQNTSYHVIHLTWCHVMQWNVSVVIPCHIMFMSNVKTWTIISCQDMSQLFHAIECCVMPLIFLSHCSDSCIHFSHVMSCHVVALMSCKLHVMSCDAMSSELVLYMPCNMHVQK